MMVAEEAAATDRMKFRRDISLRILSSRSSGFSAGTNSGRTCVRPMSASESKLSETEGSPALDIASREGRMARRLASPSAEALRGAMRVRCAPQMSDWKPALGTRLGHIYYYNTSTDSITVLKNRQSM